MWYAIAKPAAFVYGSTLKNVGFDGCKTMRGLLRKYPAGKRIVVDDRQVVAIATTHEGGSTTHNSKDNVVLNLDCCSC